MSLFSDIAERLRALIRREREDADLADELAFHIEMETKKNIAHGMTAAEAGRRARIAFGGTAQVIEEVRDARGTRLLEEFRQDGGYALRAFRHQKIFAGSVVLILALGIGANVATFTVLHALLLRSLPVPHAERLVTIGDRSRTRSVSSGSPRADLASYPVYADLRDQNDVLTGLYASGRTNGLDLAVPTATGAPGVEHPRGRLVSGNYFSVLQVHAQLGRTFTGAEDRVPGGDPVAVISDRYWRRRFGATPSVVGRTILLNGSPYTIIGVTPPGFTGDIVGQPTEIWIPLMMQPTLMAHRDWLHTRSVSWLLLMGRLKPGVTLERARAELNSLEEHSLLDHAAPDEVAGVRQELRVRPVTVLPGARGFSYYRDRYGSSLSILMAAVAVVLLIVCGNVANLLLARAEIRRREMGMRLALGAGRVRLIRQLLTESAALAVTGGALGVLAAHWGSHALLALAPSGGGVIPLAVPLEPAVVGFTLAISLGTALLFGLVPAIRTSRVDLASTLRAGGRGVASAAGRGPTLGRALVSVQVALSLLLLVGTAMLVRSMRRMEHADLGVASSHLVIVGIDPRRSGYSGGRLEHLVTELSTQLGSVPGVAAATVSENGLFSGSESNTSLEVDGFTATQPSDTNVAYDAVGAGYFHAIGAHLVAGRDLTTADRAGAPKVAVVNRTMARFFFPHASAIGRRITFEGDHYAIVGVVADIEGQNIRARPRRRLYLPMAQVPGGPGALYVEVRSSGDPATLLGPIRRTIATIDPTLSIFMAYPLAELIRDSISQDLLVSKVVTLFGLLALALAALGLYGVMAYATSRRTAEFGVRMALGAKPGAVTGMMLREALMLTGAGVVLGLPAALAAMLLIRHQLFEVPLIDPVSIGVAVTVLGLGAVAAACLPAFRAARVPPVEALRAD